MVNNKIEQIEKVLGRRLTSEEMHIVLVAVAKKAFFPELKVKESV